MDKKTNKILVTHTWPDLDAISAAWLVTRFIPGWKNPELKFVPAGSTLDNKPPDADKNIIHVDTGLGKFDHHQLSEKTSATEQVFKYLVKKKLIPARKLPAIERIVRLVNLYDNFQQVNFPNPDDDIYDLSINELIEGLKMKLKNDREVTLKTFELLDALLYVFISKIRAEKEIEKGLIFQTKHGKGIAIISSNGESDKLALKKGFAVVIKKDKNRNFLKIKAHPNTKIDLTYAYKVFKEKDPKALWYLHQSKKILINGHIKNPNFVPTKLNIKTIIEVLQNL